jgi:plastocyanin
MKRMSFQWAYWLLLFAMVGVLVSALAACSTTPSTTPTPTLTGTATPTPTPTGTPTGIVNKVSIQGFAFNPSSITVSVGTTVTWTNNDSVTHTVTSDTGAFSSGNLNPGQTFSHTFNQAGTFAYHCSIHTSMHGTVVVQ